MSKETKYVGGRVVEVKEEQRNGEPVGILAGYIATWDIDRGAYGTRDQFVRGAFSDSIREHQAKSNRPIRLKDQHYDVVGGFPIDSVREDEIGLFAIGEVNLNTQKGKEIMALARQGVLSDFSIGFSVVEFTEDDGLRRITKAIIWEASVVEEPMNPFAKITEVKKHMEYPIAEKNHPWDEKAATSRLAEFTERGEEYKGLPIVDVVNGRLTVIPNAVFKAATTATNADDIQFLEQIYAKMNMESPFKDEEKQYFIADDVKNWTPRDIEKALRKTGTFSKSAAKIIAGIDKSLPVEQNTKNILDELNAIKDNLQKD